MLAVHKVVTTDSNKPQWTLGELVNQHRHTVRTASLDQLPTTTRPPAPDDQLELEGRLNAVSA